jgi:hypothetical protein
VLRMLLAFASELKLDDIFHTFAREAIACVSAAADSQFKECVGVSGLGLRA